MAIGATILISWLNYIGVRRAGEFQFLFTLLKVAIILGIVAVGFSYSGGTWANFATEFTGAKGGVAGFFAALVAALWAYDGWNDLNMVAGEIRNPQRNIPLSLIWGVATVGALYILVNAAVQYVLPAAAVAGFRTPGIRRSGPGARTRGASLVSAGMAVSMLVTLNGTIMSGARVPFAMARDGYFFKAIAEVHPRFHTPSVSIIVQCGLAIILLLLGRQFPAILFAGDFCGVALLHDRRQHRLRFPSARAERRPALPRLGISGGSGSIRAGFRGSSLLHIHRQPEEFRWRMPGHSGRAFRSSISSRAAEASTEVTLRSSSRTSGNLQLVTKGHAQATRLPPAQSPLR